MKKQPVAKNTLADGVRLLGHPLARHVADGSNNLEPERGCLAERESGESANGSRSNAMPRR